MKAKSSAGLRSAIKERTGLAERLADVLGSIWFLTICLILILFYMAWNIGLISVLRPFDPSPFNVLDTILSIFAIVLSVSVLISQNRQRRQEKIREQVEFEINVRAEHEITKILEMLHEIQQKMGIDKHDRELEEMKKETDITDIHQKVQKNS